MNNRQATITLGISSCLLGEQVRYDGNHQFYPELINKLQALFELTSFCPEVNAGLGVPRPAIQLFKSEQGVYCAEVEHPEKNVTRLLKTSFAEKADDFAHLSGFVLKTKSPSCGLSGVKQFSQLGLYRNGRGLFAEFIRQHYPDMPVTDEISLNNSRCFERFVRQVVCYSEKQSV